jgi:DNA-binding transcriptional LysR family regulator
LQGGPRGWLRVTAPYSFAISRITPLFGEFQARYPEVRVEMVLTNEPLDLIGKEIDLALRVGPPRDTSLVARRLAVFRSQVYASPQYLARARRTRAPRRPAAPSHARHEQVRAGRQWLLLATARWHHDQPVPDQSRARRE